MLMRFWKSEDGATMVEYGLIAGILSLAIIGGFGMVADGLERVFSTNANIIDQARH